MHLRRSALPLTLSSSLPLALLLSGCTMVQNAAPAAGAGAALSGSVHGGQQPIVGTHVYLFAANTTGYGNASVSLLTAATGNPPDNSGGATNGDYYVTTGANGIFTITSDYTCTANTQVYLYAVGGDPGSGTVNPAAGLLAALGNCPGVGNFLGSTPFIVMNEVSTIATAYSFAGFATDATHVSSSGTALAQVGIANAFANAANLETIWTGNALAATPAGNGVVPQATINTLANILAACVNSIGPTSPQCTTLLSAATTNGTVSGTAPTDTANAAINIAHNPSANIPTLCGLEAAVVPFLPNLPCNNSPIPFYPNDLTLGIQFTGGGLNSPDAIAIDGLGNAWVANLAGGGIVTELSSSGAFLSGTSGYSYNSGGLGLGQGIAIDSSGDAWITNGVNLHITTYGGSINELSSAGAVLSGPGGYTVGGVTSGGATVVANPSGIGIDSTGNVWFTNMDGGGLTEISSGGSLIRQAGGGGIGLANALAISGTGNVWATSPSSNTVSEFISSGIAKSPITGYTGGGISFPFAVAVDNSGNAWIANGASVTKLSDAGVLLSGSGYTGGRSSGFQAIAIDGSGNAFVGTSSSVVELSNSGSVISLPTFGYTGGSPFRVEGIAVDGSGNVWTANNGSNSVTELIGAGTPVVTPLVTGVTNNTLGTRP